MPYAPMRDGARLHYYEIGFGPRTCVLLHGFAMAGAAWLPFVAPLLHRCRFILPDLRGFGRSHALRLSQTSVLTQHADDLADLVAHLKLDDFYLGGLSMGACTSMQYHQHYGFERVRAYLHIDQAPCVTNSGDWCHGLLGEAQATSFAEMAALMTALEPYRDHRYAQLPRALKRTMWERLAVF